MRREPDIDRDFQRALHVSSLCPRCGTTFEGGLCPNPACLPDAAPSGPLGRRSAGIDWAPHALTPHPSVGGIEAPWDVELPLLHIGGTGGDGQAAPISGPVLAPAFAGVASGPAILPPLHPSLAAAPPGYAPPADPGYLGAVYRPLGTPPRGPSQIKAALLALGLVIALVAVGVLAYTQEHASPSATTPAPASHPATYPATWDVRVQPLVDFVQSARGLTFKHPVSVNFLTQAEYNAVAGDGSASPSASTLDAEEVGLARAQGLASGSVDLGATGNALVDNGTLALYDYQTKRIDVLGTTLTVSSDVTLVHELTHALQDQYYDIGRVEQMTNPDAAAAFRDLVEGDAIRIQNDYVAGLPAADQAAYQAANDASAGPNGLPPGLDAVPPAFLTIFSAPYVVGPEFVDALVDAGGNTAVDNAFEAPPDAESLVLHPWSYLGRVEPVSVPEPKVPPGAKAFDGGPQGALQWYVMLAQRISPVTALQAADAWDGDNAVAYTQGGVSCFQADIRGSTPADVETLDAAFTQWAATMPGAPTVTQQPAGILVTGCDPGVAADLSPVATAQDALVLLLARTEVARGMIANGAATSVATCSGTRVAESYSEAQLASGPGALFGSAAALTQLERVIAPCVPAGSNP